MHHKDSRALKEYNQAWKFGITFMLSGRYRFLDGGLLYLVLFLDWDQGPWVVIHPY